MADNTAHNKGVMNKLLKGIGDWFNKWAKAVAQINLRAQKAYTEKTQANALVSMANKRLKKFIENGLTDAPIYEKYMKALGDSEKFSLKGKAGLERKRHIDLVQEFLTSKTSTMKGLEVNMAQLAQNFGFHFKNYKQMLHYSNNFFKLQKAIIERNKMLNKELEDQQYGYRAYMVEIQEYLRQENIELEASAELIDKMAQDIADGTRALEARIALPSGKSVTNKENNSFFGGNGKIVDSSQYR